MWSFFSRDPTKDFPYEIKDSIPTNSERTFWKLHKGIKKGTGEEVTIFILDGRTATSAEVDAAKSTVKRLKTLRHPSILTFLDSVESDKGIYLATESVEPLETHLERKDSIQGDLSVSWGLFQITRAISFLINDGNLKHNNIHLGSVFVNVAGEWKLGGVEFISGIDSSNPSKVPSSLHSLDPPEVKKGSKPGNKWSKDSWGMGVLIWETFNGLLKQESSLKSPGSIPKTLITLFNELVNANSSSRPNPADVIARSRRPGGFYKNDLIDSLLFIEEIQIKEQTEKTKFFNGLPNALDKFPTEICKHKILPQLINAFEFGNAGSSVLAPLFKLGKLMDEAEYQAKIVPCVVKLFASTERATRVRLLQQLEHIGDHLLPATVNDKIFPNVVTGFMDTNPTVREQTVKAMLYLAPKLNNNNLNVELLKHFARLQVKDDQGGIRTNTTICLGKIACYLSPQTRRKILIPAFTRVFQDSFPQAKIAGVLGLAATQQYYLLSEVSMRIIPALSTLTCDPDKSVRENVFKTIKGFLGKLEKVSEDPTLKEQFEADVDTSTPNMVDAASSWAGWAVSALTSKLNRSQSQQSSSSVGQIGQPPISGPTTSRPKSGAGGRYQFGGHSSSSTSTTTSSSIPSTPSADRDVLQPTVEGQESATDYDDDWDNEAWGSIDADDGSKPSKQSSSSFDAVVPSSKRGSTSGNARSSSAAVDNWDSWAINETEENDGGWDDDFALGDSFNYKPQTSPANNRKSTLNHDHGSTTKIQDTKKSVDNSYYQPASGIEKDDDATAHSASRSEDMRKRREERKLHRQHELETKRTTKTSGPLKLGTKKTIE